MKVSPLSQICYFSSVVVVLFLSQGAFCVEESIEINANQKSSSLATPISISTSPQVLESNGTKHDTTESITKQQQLPSVGSSADLADSTTIKANLSHDSIFNNTGLTEHSTDATVSAKPQILISSTTASSVTDSTSKIASNASSPVSEGHPSSVAPTVPVHRKSKPEETIVDETTQDSGPTTDYVVPLVVAMLAVPLVGVLCALLYMKVRDFWERRHYGRIDFLWDSRNDSRMDFLIDGMYNN